MATIFVSYSRADDLLLDRVRSLVESTGHSVWIDRAGIVAGQRIPRVLQAAIQDCSACLFLVTAESLSSSWCAAETGAFWGFGKPVIPFLADPGLGPGNLPEHFRGVRCARDDGELGPSLLAALATSPHARLDALVGWWWQYTMVDDGQGAIALVRLERDPVAQLRIGGDSWTTAGRPHGGFHTRAADLSPDQKTLHYYWVGEHPAEPGAPRYFGTGDAQLQGEGDRTRLHTGRYRALDQQGTGNLREVAVRYLRAEPAEVEVMLGVDPAAQRRCLAERLAHRAEVLA